MNDNQITLCFVLFIILGTAILGAAFSALIKLKPYFPIWLHNARVALVHKLKKSERFMTWLNEPTISEQIDADYTGGQITVYGGWR